MPDNKAIMDAMARQQGQGDKQTKNSLDIIREAVGRESGMDFDTFSRKLVTALKDPKNKIVQFGDTVFLMRKTADGIVELHTFSSEPPKMLIKRFTDAARFLKKQNIKTAVTYADNPAYLKVAKATGLPVKTSKVTKTIGGQAKPMYQFEVTL
jgi:hypothetical protein